MVEGSRAETGWVMQERAECKIYRKTGQLRDQEWEKLFSPL